MAEQIGIGTLLGSDFAVTGYADADGRRLIRVKSSLRKLKWKRAATMANSREAARHFGAASSIAGGIWANVPGGLRRLMDSGAFNRLVSTCRMLQEWDGNLGDYDGFRNLELSEGAYGPHRVVRSGSGWGVVGLEELWEEVDRVTVVSDERLRRKDESLDQDLQDSQDFQKLGGTGDVDESGEMRDESADSLMDGGGGFDERLKMKDESLMGRRDCGGDFDESGELREDRARSSLGGESRRLEALKRRRRIRRMAGVVEESDFRHGPGRKWDRVEEVYGQEENPRVRFWEGRGMFDYGRVTPPRIELAQRFLRSPYVSCWPFEGNLGHLDSLRNVDGAWTSSVRPDRRYRVWVQACEIGRVREAGGRAGARFQLESVGGSPLGSGGYVSEWTVVRGERASGLAGDFASVAGFDEGGERRDESLAGDRLAGDFVSVAGASVSARVAGFDERGEMRDESADFDERGKMKDESHRSGSCSTAGGAEGIGYELVSHGGTGVFVVIAGIEVAEKRGRHWVRLPWCCKVRVVDVKQNSQNSQDLQNSQTRLLPGSQDSLCVDQDSGNWELRSGCLEDVGMDGEGMPDLDLVGKGASEVADLVWAAMVVEFKGIRDIGSGMDWVGLEAMMGWIALGLGP